ncbi:MAG: MFS transporter [Clostridia bacterium]|nr:MFS transporter [Clostridia bacterium]
MNKNEKIYKVFRVLGYDYFLYNVIIFLFITEVKGISVSEYLYMNSFYCAAIAILEIPMNYIVERIGIKKSIVLGGFFWIVHCLMIMLFKDFKLFLLANLFCALGTSFKGLSETQMLYSSLKSSNRTREFARLEGKCVSKYYYIEGICSIFVGSLFTLNSYLPISITLIILMIAFLVSLRFDEVKAYNQDGEIGVREYVKDFKLVIGSRRIVSILLYAFCMSGIIGVMATLQKSLIVELDVNATAYSIIFAILTLCIGLGSRLQNRIEKYTKRKNLTFIGLTYTLLFMLLGSFNMLNFSTIFLIVVTVIILFFQNILQGVYRISVKKYMNNFTTSRVRGKILAIFYIFENIGQTLFLFLAGYIIDSKGTSLTTLIIGGISFIIILLVLGFMKNRLGLDPEQYDKKDIFYTDISKK